MKKTLKNYWAKTEKFRASMPEIISPNLIKDLYGEDPTHPEESFKDRINRLLYQYKEIKSLCKLTHIEGFYYVIILVLILIFIFVGFFDNYLTIFLATSYPLYMSFKTLQFHIGEEKPDGTTYNEEDEKKDIIQWLSYWIFYSIFINLESIFGSILKSIPLYFFFKVIFLLLCFLPQYQLAGWIYNNMVKRFFAKYEKSIVDYSSQIIKTFTRDEEKVEALRKQKTMAVRKNRKEEFENDMAKFINDDFDKTVKKRTGIE